MARTLGVVNGRVYMRARMNGKEFGFDGTTLDLTRKAIELGGIAGSRITSELGEHVLTHNPYESRIPEKLWADKVFGEKQ